MDTALRFMSDAWQDVVSAWPWVVSIFAILGLAFWIRHKGGYFSGSPRKAELNLLLSIVGPSIACGIFLVQAILALSNYQYVSFGLLLLLALMTLFVAIASCKKIFKLIPNAV